MNLRPPGYEPGELPDCSTPRRCLQFTNPFPLPSAGKLEQVDATLEHSARVRNLCENAAKLLPLLGIEAREEPLVDGVRGLPGDP